VLFACGFESLHLHRKMGVSKWSKEGDCKSSAKASRVRILPPRFWKCFKGFQMIIFINKNYHIIFLISFEFDSGSE
jgi:hypothetical protein